MTRSPIETDSSSSKQITASNSTENPSQVNLDLYCAFFESTKELAEVPDVARGKQTSIYIYIWLVCLFVSLCPINVKTA